MRWLVALGAWLVLCPASDAPAQPGDRLERFRDAAVRYLRAGDGGDALAELHALVDAEVLDSLRSGEPFASVAFIQEQLDAYASVWGGAAFRVVRLGSPAGPSSLTLGVVAVTGGERAASVRIYGVSAAGRPDLLGATTQSGVVAVHEWPATADGAVRFAAAWADESHGRVGRPLRIEIWQRRGSQLPARVWSSTVTLGDDLVATGWTVRAGEIVVRYEPRYPGWKPGCAGQTEQEDTFRPTGPNGLPTLVQRRVLNGWHRELGAQVGRLLAALAVGDERALAELVPDPALRQRLPASLSADPACEERNPDALDTVVVAVTHAAGGRLRPWSLWWSRTRAGWRLTAAGPVLE